MVIVSHDREFLDQLCTKIVETERGVAASYKGACADAAEQGDGVLGPCPGRVKGLLRAGAVHLQRQSPQLHPELPIHVSGCFPALRQSLGIPPARLAALPAVSLTRPPSCPPPPQATTPST